MAELGMNDDSEWTNDREKAIEWLTAYEQWQLGDGEKPPNIKTNEPPYLCDEVSVVLSYVKELKRERSAMMTLLKSVSRLPSKLICQFQNLHGSIEDFLTDHKQEVGDGSPT